MATLKTLDGIPTLYWKFNMASETGITGFIEIFEGRLNKMKLHLKEELGKAKHDRDRKAIRRIIADARKLNRTLKEMRNSNTKLCPYCGEKL